LRRAPRRVTIPGHDDAARKAMSDGALTLHRGTIYVGTWARTARVRAFDRDGAELEAGFSFRDAEIGRSTASGLAVDDDRHVWIADRAAGRVRLFTLFGAEIGGLGAGRVDVAPELEPDTAGEVRDPVDVVVAGDSDALQIVVASGGRRRHAVQTFGGSGRLVRSLLPLGDPRGRFRGVAGLGLCGRTLAVAERDAGRVQVFRDGEFHFAFGLGRLGGAFAPTAVEPLACGRFVVAHAGRAATARGGRGKAREAVERRETGETGGAGGIELFDAGGRHLAVLAGPGRAEGCVSAPTDLAVDAGADDRATRVFAIDRDGERVQVFTLAGRCYGSFPGLSGGLGLG
jgi:hypothetical protein